MTFFFDEETLSGAAGANLAATLLAAGRPMLRASPRLGGARGAFCLMGSCQECVVWVDGERRPACKVLIRAGMAVRSGTIQGGGAAA